MFSNGMFGTFYRFGELVLVLLYVNLLWILFTVLGLIVFGIGPSTVSMYAVFREWSIGKSDVPVFRTFFKTYRKEFLKANGLGLLLLTVAYMLYINLNFLEFDDVFLQTFTRVVLIFSSVVFGIMLIYIFPVYVHYDNKFFNHFKNATLIAIYQPLRTVYAIAACLTLYYLFFYLPVFILLMGASLTSSVLMFIAYRTFIKIEYKQELLNEKSS